MLLARPAELKITSQVLVFIDLHHIHRQTLHLATQQLNVRCSHLYRLLPFNVVLACTKFSIASMTLAKSQSTQGTSVPHLMCWQTEETATTARRCCGVFCVPGAGYKTANLLTYLIGLNVPLTRWSSMANQWPVCLCQKDCLWSCSLNPRPSKFPKCLFDHIWSPCCDPDLWPFDHKIQSVYLCS